MANIIPMAGLGSRFSKEGYTTPKPLISVSGIPMIIQVIRSLPKSDKWIFIVRQEHIKEHNIDQIIQSEIPKAIIISINKTTSGQANTCLLAQAYLNHEEPVLVAACDNISTYNKEKYIKFTQDPKIDCIVWTFTKMKKLEENPRSWGWVKLTEDNQTIDDVSVKTPISNNPYNDHALVATFYFKKAKDFIDAVNLMIKKDHRTNNEFYFDSVPVFLNKLNKKSIIFDVDHHICWGTPQDLREYESWEKFFKENQQFDKNTHDKEEYLFWKRYFLKNDQT